MNFNSVKKAFYESDFSIKYRDLCDMHDDFSNRFSSNQRRFDYLMEKSHFEAEYFKKDAFYRITDELGSIELTLHLSFNGGLVEPILFITCDGDLLVGGRLDFIFNKIGVEFEKKKINIPIYRNEKELSEIIHGLFVIYDSLKQQLFKLVRNSS